MSEAFPITPYSDVLDARAEEREQRRQRLKEGHASLSDYHADKYPLDRPAPLQQVAHRGFDYLKGKR
jgi:hypothetical protein